MCMCVCVCMYVCVCVCVCAHDAIFVIKLFKLVVSLHCCYRYDSCKRRARQENIKDLVDLQCLYRAGECVVGGGGRWWEVVGGGGCVGVWWEVVGGVWVKCVWYWTMKTCSTCVVCLQEWTH